MGADGNNRAVSVAPREDVVQVSVVYALPDAVWERSIVVDADATLRGAIERSGVLETFPALRDHDLSAGVYGALRSLDDPLHDGDRIEIYRPLQVDPKDARRIRAEVRRRAAQRTRR